MKLTEAEIDIKLEETMDILFAYPPITLLGEEGPITLNAKEAICSDELPSGYLKYLLQCFHDIVELSGQPIDPRTTILLKLSFLADEAKRINDLQSSLICYSRNFSATPLHTVEDLSKVTTWAPSKVYEVSIDRAIIQKIETIVRQKRVRTEGNAKSWIRDEDFFVGGDE